MIFSIIITAYNEEEFILDCVNSALNQNFLDFEVIVVNDGSTDSTKQLLTTISNDKLKIVNIENSGLSTARNIGYSYSCGDVILFLDGDDLIDCSILSESYSAMIKNDADIVSYNSEVLYSTPDRTFTPSYKRNSFFCNKIMCSSEFFVNCIKNNEYFVPAWMYVFKRELFENNFFYPGIYHEDILFTTGLLLKNNSKIYCLNKYLHVRRICDGSIMTSRKTEKHIVGYLAVSNNLLLIAENDLRDKEVVIQLYKFILSCIFQNIRIAFRVYKLNLTLLSFALKISRLLVKVPFKVQVMKVLGFK